MIVPQHLTINAAAATANANVFVVTLNYDASKMFIYSLPSFVPVPSPNMVSSAAIQRGGF